MKSRTFLKRAPSAMPPFYFKFAMAAFAAAWLLVGLEPSVYAGFFYHSKAMAVTHLVTLGWISGSILGSLYMVAPMALRARLRESRLDQLGFWSYSVGVTGMVSHFWLDTFAGMIWSALLVLFGLAVVGSRCFAMLQRSKVPIGVKLHLWFAFSNILVAAVFGMALGLAKLGVIDWSLTSTPLDRVAAHAHLAAFGWSTMMFCGIAHRLLPMILPSAVPAGRWTAINAVLLEIGVVGLFVSLAFGFDRRLSAVLVGLALTSVVSSFGWMMKHRRRPARGTPRLPTLQVGLALVYLVLAGLIGLLLVFAEIDPTRELRLVPVYGVFLLVGFLGQTIQAVGQRIIPLYRWFRLGAQQAAQPVKPYSESVLATRWRTVSLVGWVGAVPLLAAGFSSQSVVVIAVGSWSLFFATVATFATVRYE